MTDRKVDGYSVGVLTCLLSLCAVYIKEEQMEESFGICIEGIVEPCVLHEEGIKEPDIFCKEQMEESVQLCEIQIEENYTLYVEEIGEPFILCEERV